MPTPSRFAAALAATLAFASCAAAESDIGTSSLLVRQNADASSQESASDRADFGDKGAWYWTILGGAAFHHESTDGSLYFGAGTFLTDQFEFNFGVAGWHFWQEGDDTAGGNPAFGFRYHFTPKDAFNLYIEAGIGLLFTADDVPEDGESVNFTPRAGVGTLWKLTDESNAPRLDVGVRWHHISTASTSGSDDNPSRDSIMVYAGVVFPF